MNRCAIPTIVAAGHVPHVLHRDARVWAQSNCYADLWIELLHALGLDPHAMLSHTLAVDFEGDQWTFFKPKSADLWQLYGIDVEELQIWKNFAGHVISQISRGRVVLAEVDGYHLPDTAGTSYRTEHVKTTIGIERIDVERRRLGYFHNGGYHLVEGEDYAALLTWPQALPPYVELVKLEHARGLDESELKRRARALLLRDLARRPAHNPLRAHVEHFGEHARELAAGDLAGFHLYAFATLRQCGSAFELGAAFLRWLEPEALASAAVDLELVATAARSSLLKLARAVQRGQPPDLGSLAEVVPSYSRAFAAIDRWLGARGEAA